MKLTKRRSLPSSDAVQPDKRTNIHGGIPHRRIEDQSIEGLPKGLGGYKSCEYEEGAKQGNHRTDSLSHLQGGSLGRREEHDGVARGVTRGRPARSKGDASNEYIIERKKIMYRSAMDHP